MHDLHTKPAHEPFSPMAVFSHIYPLDEFYAQSGKPLPAIGRVKSDEMPEPYRSLLVHESDMTPTLEKHHGGEIHIRVLSRHNFENEYFRKVVLLLNGSEKPVEYGAIKIVLDLFPHDAQQEILKEHRPLGTILRDYKIPHGSRPSSYLTVAADEEIGAALKLTGTPTLYGRRNTLVDPWDRPLAEIVEILPP